MKTPVRFFDLIHVIAIVALIALLGVSGLSTLLLIGLRDNSMTSAETMTAGCCMVCNFGYLVGLMMNGKAARGLKRGDPRQYLNRVAIVNIVLGIGAGLEVFVGFQSVGPDAHDPTVLQLVGVVGSLALGLVSAGIAGLVKLNQKDTQLFFTEQATSELEVEVEDGENGEGE